MKILCFEKGHEDLKGMLFVADGLTKNKTERRLHKTCIFIDGINAVSTNGYELQVYQMSKKVRNGFYRVVVKKPGVIVLKRVASKSSAFPDYKPVLKKATAKEPTVSFVKGGKKDWYELSSVLPEIMHHIWKGGMGYNVSFIMSLPKGTWHASIFPTWITFEDDTGTMVKVGMNSKI